MVKDFFNGREYSGLSDWTLCNHKGSYNGKREAGESESKRLWKQRLSDVINCWLLKWRKGVESKNGLDQLEKARNWILPCCLQKEHYSAITLMTQTHFGLKTDLQNHKIINL